MSKFSDTGGLGRRHRSRHMPGGRKGSKNKAGLKDGPRTEVIDLKKAKHDRIASSKYNVAQNDRARGLRALEMGEPTQEIVPSIALPLEEVAQPIRPSSLIRQPDDESLRANIFIYDKNSARYSYRQLDSALVRAKHSGILSAFSFWLIFITFTLIVDFTQSTKYLLNQRTYLVVESYDLGFFSGLGEGKFGWIIIQIILLALAYGLVESFWSRNTIWVLTGLGAIMILEIITLFVALYGRSWIPNPVTQPEEMGLRPYQIVMISVGAVWIAWQAVESFLMWSSVKDMESLIELPQETTVLE